MEILFFPEEQEEQGQGAFSRIWLLVAYLTAYELCCSAIFSSVCFFRYASSIKRLSNSNVLLTTAHCTTFNFSYYSEKASK